MAARFRLVSYCNLPRFISQRGKSISGLRFSWEYQLQMEEKHANIDVLCDCSWRSWLSKNCESQENLFATRWQWIFQKKNIPLHPLALTYSVNISWKYPLDVPWMYHINICSYSIHTTSMFRDRIPLNPNCSLFESFTSSEWSIGTQQIFHSYVHFRWILLINPCYSMNNPFIFPWIFRFCPCALGISGS